MTNQTVITNSYRPISAAGEFDFDVGIIGAAPTEKSSPMFCTSGPHAALMDGMDDREITFPVGHRTQTLKGSDYLLHFSMPNFYFHVTTAYAILRHNGVVIGKGDFMGDE